MWLVSSGVVDSPMTGSSTPDGYVNSFNWEIAVLLLAVFLVGFVLGFGLRHLIQAIKDICNNGDKWNG